MILEDFIKSFQKHKDRNAFCIDECFYTYDQFLKRINAIRTLIAKNIPENEINIGLITHDDLDTYAAIFAIWFEGKTYVPILNYAPEVRNSQILSQAGCNYIITSIPYNHSLPGHILTTNKLTDNNNITPIVNTNENLNAYILFTSGSTGLPKGVPITLKCISSLIEAVEKEGDIINCEDKVLQMFELTFDLSVISYVHPLLNGACIFTIPDKEVKNLYIMDLLEIHKLTVLLLVPSIIILLRPYYKFINGDSVRLCSFCGEALPLDCTNEWRKCVPNARIRNYYGPTEDTVYCTFYDIDDKNQKNYNGSVSIGRSLKSGSCIIVDSENNILPNNQKGELCLAGNQLTLGYLNNNELNLRSFFQIEGTRYYRTGDLCYIDDDNDIMYIGRMDFQTKINGFRVELSEIEYHANKSINNQHTCICVAYKNNLGAYEIGLAIDSTDNIDTSNILKYLNEHLPPYEIPSSIKVFNNIPLNINGKIDRKQIIKYFENEFNK